MKKIKRGNLLAIVFLGPPGAGKGTQAKDMARRLGLAHVASGDVFREAIKARTTLGRKVERIVTQGKLVSNSVATQVILEHLRRLRNPKGFILDGFPRTRAQAVELDHYLRKTGRRLSGAIWFFARRSTVIRRLSARTQCPVCGEVFNLVTHPPRRPGRCGKCGGRLARRRDDEPRVIRKRLQVYARTARPLLSYYRVSDRLFRIDGEKKIADLSHSLAGLIRGLRKNGC